jgi:hypothetical protein
VVSFAPEIQCGFGETLLSFNSSQGFSLCPMFDTNQFTQGFPVFQINHAGLPSVFKTSTIISIDVKNYDGFVYNLAVDDDESYVAEGIIVHNCRSSMLLVTMNGGPIRQEDASQWLRRRDAAYQDEVLGPARGRMFRAGALTPRGLLDAATGRPLTLEDLGA